MSAAGWSRSRGSARAAASEQPAVARPHMSMDMLSKCSSRLLRIRAGGSATVELWDE